MSSGTDQNEAKRVLKELKLDIEKRIALVETDKGELIEKELSEYRSVIESKIQPIISLSAETPRAMNLEIIFRTASFAELYSHCTQAVVDTGDKTENRSSIDNQLEMTKTFDALDPSEEPGIKTFILAITGLLFDSLNIARQTVSDIVKKDQAKVSKEVKERVEILFWGEEVKFY